jgi:TonB family protein
MKFCPTCQTRFDEEILRFCTKDGTSLVEENQPNFTEMPSESAVEDDFGEETVIRRKPLPPADKTENARESKPRIIIPTTEKKIVPTVGTKTTQVYRQPIPQKSNTSKIVFSTILGTIVLLAGAGGAFLFLGNRDSGENNQNVNINTNLSPIDVNLNTNLSVGNSLVDFNSNTDFNGNLNININTNTSRNTNIAVKTPTPRPSPTPSIAPTPNANANQNSNNMNSATPPPSTPVNTRPTITPTPANTLPRPLPSITAPPSNRPVNAGVLNGRAVNLPTPAYPPTARQVRASGRVTVQVLVDESGNVLSARATGGHPMLRAPAEAAARQSRFNPVKVGDRSVQATGVVFYNFINQ